MKYSDTLHSISSGIYTRVKKRKLIKKFVSDEYDNLRNLDLP